MEAVIYARISRDTAGEGLGVQRQETDCRRKAEAMGWSVAATYVDNDVSASKAVARPQYAAMLEGIESGTVRAVVVYDLDRLTRKPAELETFIDLAERHGIALANVSGDVDLTTANGRMVARIKGAVARQEADRISERTARQKAQALADGRPLGGRFRLFGYARDWSVVDGEAAVVREIFERARKGEAKASISRDLQARDVRTVTGGQWLPLQTSRILRTQRYAGLAVHKGEVVGKSAVPALVTEADFEAAQRPTPVQNRGQARKHLLSGFLICGTCKATMTSTGSRYRCDAGMGGCGGCSVRGEWVDHPLTVRISGYHQQTRYAEPFDTVDYEAEVAAIDGRIEALQASYDAGDLALEDLVPLLKIERTRRRGALSQAAADTSEVDRVMRGVAEFADAPLSVRREIVARYVKHIVILPSGKGRQPHKSAGRVEVHWTNGKVENLAKGPALYEWRD